jgi:hypothetical protein
MQRNGQYIDPLTVLPAPCWDGIGHYKEFVVTGTDCLDSPFTTLAYAND